MQKRGAILLAAAVISILAVSCCVFRGSGYRGGNSSTSETAVPGVSSETRKGEKAAGDVMGVEPPSKSEGGTGLLGEPAPGRIPSVDSTVFTRFDALLEQYYGALMTESEDVKNAEMDYLIETCKDSLLRQHIAIAAYSHYVDSPLMGEESVALHIYDRWFAPGIVKFADEQMEFEASMLSTFERSNMLYMPAQEIVTQGPYGEDVVFPQEGMLQAIVFYDTECTKCKAMLSLLPHALESFFETAEMGPGKALALNLVYAGQSEENWETFRNSFKCFAPQVKVIHSWDPEIESDYQKKYGVISTPRMLLVTGGGLIIGRRLEVESLLELMNYYYLYERNAKEEE